MPYPQLDRRELHIAPLSERKNKVYIERDHIPPTARPKAFSDDGERILEETVARMREAREAGKPRMVALGAHAIKNGLAPVFLALMEQGWLTHLATNGAGLIHDWEFSFQGCSSEDVRANVEQGQFGIWEETGFYINLAILVGAYEGLGYGESVGKFVEHQGLHVPSAQELQQEIVSEIEQNPCRAAAAVDLLCQIRTFDLNPGWMKVPHPYRKYGLQAGAFRMGIPFTGHPMIGHDIIYCHPMNHGAAIGRTAQRDFLTFAEQVTRLDGGVYLSVGSAVMSPMIFEKSMSMAQNLAIQRGQHMDNHFMVIVDLQASHWDWRQGEPPETSPDYYLRYCKSFARMGGEMRYVSADNRDFMLALLQRLEGITPGTAWQPPSAARKPGDTKA